MLLLCIGLALLPQGFKAQETETTWDPWTPCENDWDCPEELICNFYQNRCTECMENEDCPPCVEEGCPFPGEGVCVYGDHCCSPTYC